MPAHLGCIDASPLGCMFPCRPSTVSSPSNLPRCSRRMLQDPGVMAHGGRMPGFGSSGGAADNTGRKHLKYVASPWWSREVSLRREGGRHVTYFPKVIDYPNN